jgi:hypothetical protein
MLGEKGLSYVLNDDALVITSADAAKRKTETVVYCVGDLVPDGPPDKQAAAYASLIGMLTGVVEPKSWSANGGTGRILAFPPCKAIVVNQTQAIHRELAAVFDPLHDLAFTGSSFEEPVVFCYRMPPGLRSSGPEGRRITEAQLIDKIQKTAPNSWDTNKYVKLVDRTIVVRQTIPVHEQIQHLLDALRADHQGPPVSTKGVR